MDRTLRVLFHRFQTVFDRIRLTFSVASGVNKCNQLQPFRRLTQESIGDRLGDPVREHI